MRKDFYVFRHGETDCNVQGRWQGRGVNLPLNKTGEAQAQALAQRLKDLKLEVIYSSPLKRALQTAQTAASVLGVEVRVLDELTEGCLGDVEGLKKDIIAQKYPKLWDEWYNDTMIMSTRWPNGESKLEMQQRMFQGFEKMLSAKENIIGVASHSGSMRYFFYAFGYGPHKMPNTALYHLVYDNGEWTLEIMT